MQKILRSLFQIATVAVIFTATVFCQSNDKPKNIILLIGDGMGLNAVTASTLSLDNSPFTKFKTIGLVITCAADKLVTDSAAGATAFATGYKTNNGKISTLPDGEELKTIFDIAEEKNYSTGIVATFAFTNATPACFFAHNGSRHNEEEIAKQFLTSGIDVTLTGGTQFLPMHLYNKAKKDSITFLDSLKNAGYSYFDNFEDLNENKTSNKICALLEKYALPKAASRNYTLGNLTKIALDKLSQNKNGFVLMVEGSQIDKGGEYNDYDFLMGEQKDFNTAVNEALEFAEKDGNTLVVVTADHESGGLAILGKDKKNIEPKWAIKKSHTAAMVGIFSYGPGSQKFTGILENNQVGRILINYIDPKISW